MAAFNEVAAVAFYWSQRDLTRYQVNDLRSAYGEILGGLDLQSSPAQVVPELAAAIHELIRDPNRADAVYGLVDIGGGTLDGTIFQINWSRIGAASPNSCGAR